MPRRLIIPMVTVLAMVLFPAVLLRARSVQPAPRPADLPPIPGVETGLASIRVDSTAGVLEVSVGPVSLPAGTPGYRPPVQLVRLPVGGSFHGWDWQITDALGNPLPPDLLHHVNLIDPDERELFSNRARHVFAAGRETPGITLTRLIGYPLAEGTRLLIISMFSNTAPRQIDSAYLRVRLHWAPLDRLVKPLPVFPFVLDVMGPVGDKSFPVPPGRTVRSWEGSPRVDARILAIGGHLHDFASTLRLEDLTTGQVLWETAPVTEAGRLLAVPAAMPWKTGGIKLHRERRYRVTAVYDNPTDRPAPHGGMGVVAGVVYVGQAWPHVSYDDEQYRADLANIIAAPMQAMSGHAGHAH